MENEVIEKLTTDERRLDIINRIRVTGPIGMSTGQLGKIYGVSRNQIWKDYVAIGRSLIEDKSHSTIMLTQLEQTLSFFTRTMNSPEIEMKDRINAGKGLLQAIAVTIEFLERYGFKERVPEKIEIESTGINVNLSLIKIAKEALAQAK